MLTTLQVPPASAIAAKRAALKGKECQEEDCRREGCRGNRLARVVREGHEHLQLHIPHHKTQNNSGAANQKEIETSLADTSLLFTILMQLLKGGWRRVAAEADKQGKHNRHRNPRKLPRTLLLWPNGRPVSHSDFAKWWRKVGTLGAGAGCVPHTPRDCRHLFVTAVRDHGLASREEEGFAAAIMGNSSHAWDLRYDQHKDLRLVRKVADIVGRLRGVLTSTLKIGSK